MYQDEGSICWQTVNACPKYVELQHDGREGTKSSKNLVAEGARTGAVSSMTGLALLSFAAGLFRVS